MGSQSSISLDTFLASETVALLTKQVVAEETVAASHAIKKDHSGVFVHLYIALLSAIYLPDDIMHKVYTHFLCTRVRLLEQPLLMRLSELETEILAKRHGSRLNKEP